MGMQHIWEVVPAHAYAPASVREPFHAPQALGCKGLATRTWVNEHAVKLIPVRPERKVDAIVLEPKALALRRLALHKVHQLARQEKPTAGNKADT
jgi:hypothetical protein